MYGSRRCINLPSFNAKTAALTFSINQEGIVDIISCRTAWASLRRPRLKPQAGSDRNLGCLINTEIRVVLCCERPRKAPDGQRAKSGPSVTE
jgi:hypothetical protein